MKINNSYLVITFMFVFLYASISCAEDYYSLKVVDRKFPVIFEDNNYEEELKRIVIEDVQHVYSFFNLYEISPMGSVQTHTYKFTKDGHILNIKAALHFGNNKNYSIIPDAFWRKPLGYIVEWKTDEVFIVPNVVIEEYIEQIDFRKQNNELFEKLPDFINLFNEIDKESFTDEEIEALFYNVNLPSKPDIRQLRSYVSTFSQYSIPYFSSVHECKLIPDAEKKNLKLGDEEVIYCDVPFVEKETGNYAVGVPVGAVNGKWYFLLVYI